MSGPPSHPAPHPMAGHVVAAGFEHSIANMFFIPMGLVLRENTEVVAAAGLPAGRLASLDLGGLAANLAASTLVNVVGGSVLVGLVYRFAYLRPDREGR